MSGYIVRRLLSAFLVIVLSSMIVFALFFLGPSNPAAPICDGGGGRCTSERLELIEDQLGLNDSVVNQYGLFVKGIFVGREIDMGAVYDCSAPCLGVSYGSRGEVTDELLERLPATLAIAVGGSVIYLIVGITIGVVAAKYRGTNTDRGLVGSALLISSVPYYIFALIVWLVFELQLGWFQSGYFSPFEEGPGKFVSGMALPWLVVGLTFSASYARFTRGSMVETINEDYMRTATAKGLGANTVLFRHGLRAAIVPVVTIFGLDFAALLGGTIFTEQIFRIEGIGRWALDAVQSPQDFAVINATVLFAATMVVLANLIVDIVYGFLDPRVKVG